MENIKQVQILEEIENLSKEIQQVIIERTQNQNIYNDRLKSLYIRLHNLYTELKRLIPSLSIPKNES